MRCAPPRPLSTLRREIDLLGLTVQKTVHADEQRRPDVAADGQRFLMIKLAASDPTSAPPQIVVVQHFDEELKRLVPTK